MKSYSIAVILWNDHYYADRQSLPISPDEFIETPTLSVGIIVNETENTLLLASTIEPGGKEFTYLAILKPTIVGIKKYGKIKLEKLT